MDNNDKSLTPMMEQYNSIKKDYADSLLFYRLGDFYELFYDDAIIASKELGLVLTKRVSVPMCGVPWHAAEMYLIKLVKNGHRVAICEQIETPEEARKKRGYKATVERRVIRIVTKGTLIEQAMLGEKSNNFLLAISGGNDEKLGIAYADVSTGRFLLEEIKVDELLSVITKICPSEIICSDSLLSKKEILTDLDKYKSIVRAMPSSKFTSNSASNRLAKFFDMKFIDAFGNLPKHVIEAASEVVEYISEVHKSDKICLSFPKFINHSDYMYLDNFTRKSLELTHTQRGEKKGSLLNNIDKTMTSQGARMLSRWLMEPSTDIRQINERLDYVEFFVKNQDVLGKVRNALSNFPDMERAFTRILMDKAGPRDLKCISAALTRALELGEFLSQFSQLNSIDLSFAEAREIVQILESALLDETPLLARDGGFIRKGYDQELDEYIDALENGDLIVRDMQKKYAEETGIPNLKIKKNFVMGYFIEISPNFASKIPYKFTHRQSLASCIRYTSEELVDAANKIYSAESNTKRRELAIFDELAEMVAKHKDNMRKISDNISFLDLTSSFSQIATENNYVRPELTSEKILDIKNGRHPVVENSLKLNGAKFIANDCFMSDDVRTSLLTGPNMGGKSTYLRQNAIIIIMAQIGSFVPAETAKIGVTDRIFSRVGASDDITSGRSTFMVEMIETATILQQATENSFIILDEIGRGTSTYDGLAIAWAVIEEIADKIRARTIFATHYHELINIRDTIPKIQFLTVKVEEWQNKIIFLHKIEKGFADKSYGINVAALSGFPKNVLNRAEEILKKIS
ncbi:MAG: DNA mismatch repair protein MutS [Holosporales bacterium]|jgi:DNA mismatch repair protein MutS|nr:DNA mismatch repair protein MutS [Holosporales bacterium]